MRSLIDLFTAQITIPVWGLLLTCIFTAVLSLILGVDILDKPKKK